MIALTAVLAFAAQSSPSTIEQAAALLVAGGMESPLGAEYRDVTITVTSARYGVRQLRLAAWVKTDPATGSKSVIAWNGLSYRPDAIGELMQIPDRGPLVSAMSGEYFLLEGGEYEGAHTTRGPIAAALLYLYGRPALAATAAESYGRNSYRSNDLRAAAGIEYDLVLTSALANRMAESKDFEALLLARRAKRFRALLDETLAAAQVRLSSVSARLLPTETIESWLRLQSLRVAESDVPRPSLDEIAKLPQPERISALVERLADTRSVHSYFAGEKPPVFDGPDVRLAREGDAGIAAFIGALTDERTTRSRGAAIYLDAPKFETVGEVARRHLEAAFALGGFGGNAAGLQALFRSHWRAAKGLPLEEQWLVALENDALNVSVWESAARNLSLPPGVTPRGADGLQGTGEPPLPMAGPPLKWQSLRERAGGRVFRAIERRALQAWDEKRVQHSLVLAAAVWDTKRAVPLLRRAKVEVLEAISSRRTGDGAQQVEQLATLVSALVFVGESDAWDGYEEALAEVAGLEGPNLDLLLAPLWQHPDDPRSQAIAGRVLAPDGAFAPSRTFMRQTFRLPFITYLPEYRKALAASLDDKTVVTTGTRQGEQGFRYSLPGGGTAGGSVDPATASIPVGGTMELRVCDIVMHTLNRSFKFDGFHLALGVEARDALIARAKVELLGDDVSWISAQRPYLDMRLRIFPSRPIWAGE